MKHMRHMIGCVAMIAAVALIFLVRGGDTPSWLLIVLVLCCPLMTIAMMSKMRGDHDHGEHADSDDAHHADRR